jgi:hypothetical protein
VHTIAAIEKMSVAVTLLVVVLVVFILLVVVGCCYIVSTLQRYDTFSHLQHFCKKVFSPVKKSYYPNFLCYVFDFVTASWERVC